MYHYLVTFYSFCDFLPIFDIPPRDSQLRWHSEQTVRKNKECDRGTSVERSNQREKQYYKIENGSTTQLRCGAAASMISFYHYSFLA